MTGTGHRARLRKTPAHAITNGSGWPPHDTVMCRLPGREPHRRERQQRSLCVLAALQLLQTTRADISGSTDI
jgi:hypothetical protein